MKQNKKGHMMQKQNMSYSYYAVVRERFGARAARAIHSQKMGSQLKAKGRPAVSQQHLREGEDGGFNELNMRSYPTKTENFAKHEDDLQYPLLLDSPQRFGVVNKTDEF
jgi:hypothetical protein